jgi:hypothetical protein
MPMKEAAAVTSTLDPPTGGDVVLVPPVAGLDPSDLRHVPLALLAVAVRAGGLSGGLRPSGGGAAVPVDATRDRTFRELVAQVAAGGDGEDDPAWTPVEYHVGQTPHAGTAPVRLTVTAGTSGCTVRCVASRSRCRVTSSTRRRQVRNPQQD